MRSMKESLAPRAIVEPRVTVSSLAASLWYLTYSKVCGSLHSPNDYAQIRSIDRAWPSGSRDSFGPIHLKL
ncbi:NADH dehydrogenase subunit 5 [Novosphingobium sp. PY1]|nr:NADH dehydrogenase subunit 5 [Novosphingobium sp. PY1]